jgi:hypothetical protein
MWWRRRISLFQFPLIGRFRRENRAVNPRLVEANRFFELGKYNVAAEVYQELGETSISRQIPHAPHLFLLAGTAWMKDGQIEKAILAFKRGLSLMAERKKWGRLRQASDNVINQLCQNGFNNQADLLTSWLEEIIPSEIRDQPIWKEKSRNRNAKEIHLPAQCPSCGGPVVASALEWVGSQASCNYCGSLLIQR